MNSALALLKTRGFIQQCTDEINLGALLDNEKVTFYCGVDPTGSSLHCGHLVPLMAMRHLQTYGHRAILLAGGGTARIGDPSGKTESRQMITYDEIDQNVQAQIKQFKLVLNFENDQTVLLNNKEWLQNLNYIDFLRDIGKHFSVNRMLTFEAYKKRLEKGLNFIEFNYQLLQSYDYLVLNERENCQLQIGGDDQWGNIVAGMELIRKVRSKSSYGLTFPLVTTSNGQKMGKTEKGAVFLDAELTSVHDFYQYWRNVDDRDVKRFLLLYTFLPTEECEILGNKKDKEINASKQVLAYEITKMIHGKEEADKAQQAALALFGSHSLAQDMPQVDLAKKLFETDYKVIDLFVEAKLVNSKSESRRLIEQGGAYLSGNKITDLNATVQLSAFDDDKLILRAGKKKHARINLID